MLKKPPTGGYEIFGTSLWTWLVALCFALPLFPSCSRKVEWQEQVLLNTGSTVTVHRTATYSLQGGHGNPLDIAWRPDRIETIAFDWGGVNFRYIGERIPIVLAISPKGVPALIGPASSYLWNVRNGYACTLPFYVQFVPDPAGKTWHWPPSVERWAIGLPANLMTERDPQVLKSKFYSIEDVRQIEASGAIPQMLKKIQADYVGDECKNTRRN